MENITFGMWIWALLIGASVFIANLVVLVLVYRKIAKEKAAFIATAKAYLEPPDESTPSQFAMLTDALSKQLASNVTASIKGTFMGMQSGEAKREKAVEGALAEDVVSQSSPLGSIVASFPALKSVIHKNPKAIVTLVEMLVGMGKGGKGNNSGETTSSMSIK